jgi:hypothetical protein
MKRIAVSLWSVRWFLLARRTRSVEIDTLANFFAGVPTVDPPERAVAACEAKAIAM